MQHAIACAAAGAQHLGFELAASADAGAQAQWFLTHARFDDSKTAGADLGESVGEGARRVIVVDAVGQPDDGMF